MKYSCETTIDLPRERVVALFDNPDNLKEWQPTLESMEHISGEPGQPGAKTRLLYAMGRGKMEMIETVAARNLPDGMDLIFEANGAWNRVNNRFVADGPNHTHWTMETEFKFSSLFLRLMAWLRPSMFRNQTQQGMQMFKEFAERQG